MFVGRTVCVPIWSEGQSGREAGELLVAGGTTANVGFGSELLWFVLGRAGVFDSGVATTWMRVSSRF